MVKKILILLLPWAIKRRALNYFYGYQIHPSAKIGVAWIFPRKLIMDEFSKIDHFCVGIHLDTIELGIKSSIGRSNWITGFPTNLKNPKHFGHQPNRTSTLILGHHSAITKNHHLDCTNKISIGNFTTIAGYNSQLLTHSINVLENRQDSQPITIGNYSFVGTNVVILGGSSLPSYSVLGAKSLLNKEYTTEWTLYAGVPAKPVKTISRDAKYFNRSQGFVY